MTSFECGYREYVGDENGQNRHQYPNIVAYTFRLHIFAYTFRL